MTDTLHGIIEGLPDHLYHSRPELSSTGARRLLESPAKFRYLQDHPEPPKPVFDVGSCVHAKVLGVGAPITVIPTEYLASNGAVSTKDAKAFIEGARGAGKIPVKQAVADEVNAMSEAILARPFARMLLEQEGVAEASMFASDPDTGVDLRARFDYLATIGVDLKTGRDASKWGFERAVATHGYDVQQEHYRHIRRLIQGGPGRFVFVVVEKEPPFLCAEYQLDIEFVEIGAAKAKRAREIYAECVATDTWAGYPDEPQLLSPPIFHIADFQENYDQ